MFSLLLALIYIAFISLGLPDSLLGSGWPVMHAALGVPISYMGIVSMAISGCTIVSSLLAYKVIRRLGTDVVTIISVLLTAIALFGFSMAEHFWVLLVFAIPYGLGAGAIDVGLNNYVVLHYSSRHMSWLHCFWGAGAIVSPFVMGYALTNLSWNGGYRIIACIQTGIALLLLVTRRAWRENQEETGAQQKSIGLFDALKIRGVPCLLIGFFAYCALEATAMYWASTYLVEARGIAAERAARFASLFYIGITAGRFFGGFIMEKLGDRKMIFLGTGVLTCAVCSLMIPTGNEWIPLIGFVVIGVGCAPVYPCIVHSTPGNFGAENSAAIVSIQMASAYVGTTFMPPLFGMLAHRIGFSTLPAYLVVFVALMIGMVERTFRITAKK